VPVVGISSAYSVACQFRDIPKLGIFSDAKRREVFCTAFANGELERSTYLIPMEDIKHHESLFSLAVSAEPLPGITQRAFPHAKDLLSLSDTLPGWVKDQPLEPIYLREAVPAKPA
jgi:tRNA A37 threonylcarbamoyladenosine modification protein TsaB